MDDPFVLAGEKLGSRLIMGTGGAPSLDVLGRVPGAADPAAVPAGTPLRVVAEPLPDGRLHYAFAVAQ